MTQNFNQVSFGINNLVRIVVSVGLCYFASSIVANAQIYSDDYTNLYVLASNFQRIGNIGELETVVDLRGFVPFYGRTMGSTNADIIKADGYEYQPAIEHQYWKGSNEIFEVPTKIAIGVIYYGNDPTPDRFGYVPDYEHRMIWSMQIARTPMEKMDDVKIIPEKDLDGEFKQWANFAYDLTGHGENLFKSFNGGSGYQAAEPVSILFTENSVIVLVNFRYTDLFDQNPPGQYLVGMEFSRNLKRYKAMYPIYDTFAFSPSVRDSFEKSGPLVLESLKLLSQ